MANDEMDKILVSMAIERTLIDVGGTELHKSVEKWLYSEYRYHFSDCLEHPDSLKIILERCGDKHVRIVEKLKFFLGDTSGREPFLQFMAKINGW